MHIDFIFDTVCPWCFIGKRRLERALSLRPEVKAEIHWRPFLLNPDLPGQGISRAAYLERKFGGPIRVARMNASLRDAGRPDGIVFDFEAISVTPNTVDSHRLVRMAESYGCASRVVEALFMAYFTAGRDIGSHAELISIGVSCGLPLEPLREMYSFPSGRGEVYLDNAQTHRLSINGVPCFIFDGLYGIAGAQDPDILLKMIDMAVEGHLGEPMHGAHSFLSPSDSGLSRPS